MLARYSEPQSANVASQADTTAAPVAAAADTRTVERYEAARPDLDSTWGDTSSVDEFAITSDWARNERFSVQLPDLSEQTTNYSVTVPDGGTVLMGGIKREGFGVNTWYAGSANHFYRLSAPASARHRSYFEPLGETRLGLDVVDDRLHFADELEQQSGEQYNAVPENDFYRPLGDSAISTFSIDVDTGAYSNMRRYVSGGQLPPPDAVRIEELVNYFDYQYEQPRGDDPFSVNMELASLLR